MYKEFLNFVQTRKEKRAKTWEENARNFNERVNKKILDIRTKVKGRMERLVKATGVSMTDVEHDFLRDQCEDRLQYCDSFVDRKWKKAMERKRKEIEAQEKLFKKDKNDQEALDRSTELVTDNQENEQVDEEKGKRKCRGKKEDSEFLPDKKL